MIFNKTNNGDAEIKKALGFSNASLTYEGLESLMDLALSDLMLSVPKAVYDFAEDYYINGLPVAPPPPPPPPPTYTTTQMDRLVLLIQRVMALHAYRRYAPSNDLSHSDAGRRMYSSEGEKTPFEWMVDKDDRNLLTLAWDQTDVLLQYLNEIGFSTWTASAIYTESKKRFITSTAEFNAVFNINNSFRMFFALVPSMKTCELSFIRSCFTETVWDTMISHMVAGSTTSTENEYIRLAKLCIPFYSIADALGRLSLDMFPEGIFKSSIALKDVAKNQPVVMDRGQAIQFYNARGDKHLRDLQAEITRVNNLNNNVTPAAEDMTDRMDADYKFFRP